MAYAQQKVRQPTFNELIEQQLVEQKAKFAEYQDQVQKTLQQKLTEIATPTALQRMELRRQSSTDELSSINSSPAAEREFIVGNKKVWVGIRVSSPIIMSLWQGPRHEKTCLRGVANNTGADQPVHQRSLISAFVIPVL